MYILIYSMTESRIFKFCHTNDYRTGPVLHAIEKCDCCKYTDSDDSDSDECDDKIMWDETNEVEFETTSTLDVYKLTIGIGEEYTDKLKSFKEYEDAE